MTAQGSPRDVATWLSQHPDFEAIAHSIMAEYARKVELCGNCRDKLESLEIRSLRTDSELRGNLTQRQLSILRGMVEGKTNHELANELGFSVSTIRHETMRIYEILAVSDRKEAAKKALALALL